MHWPGLVDPSRLNKRVTCEEAEIAELLSVCHLCALMELILSTVELLFDPLQQDMLFLLIVCTGAKVDLYMMLSFLG